jgi:DNA-binding response OmpR family regulator
MVHREDMMKYKLLIVDDDEGILQLLKDYFELEGYLVYSAKSGEEALRKIELNPDLILLDINMPNLDGITVCKRIRDIISCPIIFLTARAQEEDKIQGLLVGGDDYIIKPFSIEELGARVLAHLRREERKSQKAEVSFFDGLAIQYSKRMVSWQDKEIAFTKTEFDIIEVLSMNRGRVFDKETIYEKLWGFDKEGDSSIITEHVRRIRMKLSKYTDKTFIETVWGVGYRWTI